MHKNIDISISHRAIIWLWQLIYTSNGNLVTFHPHRATSKFSPLVINRCTLNEAPWFKRLLGFTTSSGNNIYGSSLESWKKMAEPCAPPDYNWLYRPCSSSHLTYQNENKRIIAQSSFSSLENVQKAFKQPCGRWIIFHTVTPFPETECFKPLATISRFS